MRHSTSPELPHRLSRIPTGARAGQRASSGVQPPIVSPACEPSSAPMRPASAQSTSPMDACLPTKGVWSCRCWRGGGWAGGDRRRKRGTAVTTSCVLTAAWVHGRSPLPTPAAGRTSAPATPSHSRPAGRHRRKIPCTGPTGSRRSRSNSKPPTTAAALHRTEPRQLL